MRLHDVSLPKDKRADLEGELGDLLNLVAPVANYWAYPGPQRVGQLRELLAAREYAPASRTVDAITRRLVGDAAPSDQGVQYGQADDDRVGQPAPAEPWRARPSFEVLVVGDVTGEDADQLRGELRRLHDPRTCSATVHRGSLPRRHLRPELAGEIIR